MDGSPLPRRYTDVELIGQGGFGRVYRARDTNFNRLIAAKVAIHARDETPDADAFVLEARRAARLEHPNIIGVYDLDFHQDHLYLTMQYAPGGTLDDVLKREGPLAPERVALMINEAAAGLAFAHGEGLVHRDVKPSNLLVDVHGTIKVSDFGLVREVDRSTTQFAGTMAYMAPEQLTEGKYPTPAADVFALAVTAYELLTGSRHGGFSSLASGDPPPRVSSIRKEISPEVDVVLDRALEWNRLERIADVLTFAADLDRVLQGAPHVKEPTVWVPEVKPDSGSSSDLLLSGGARRTGAEALQMIAQWTTAGVKWSGAASSRDAAKAIRIAIIEDGRARVAEGLDREAATGLIDELGETSERTLVGMDFCFGRPAWHMREEGYGHAADLWADLATLEERRGRESQWPREDLGFPYWGPQIRPRPDLLNKDDWFRETERQVRDITGEAGMSAFQLSGAGTVGSQSARGAGRLLELQGKGWSIWPFDPPSDHTIVEVFPKAYRSLVVGSQLSLDPSARRDVTLSAMNRELHMDPEVLRTLEEDLAALDAMLAAWLLWREDPMLPDLSGDATAMVEGQIWLPSGDS